MLRILTILGVLNTIVFGFFAFAVGGEASKVFAIAAMVSGGITAVLITIKMIKNDKRTIDVSKNTWTSGDGGGGVG